MTMNVTDPALLAAGTGTKTKSGSLTIIEASEESEVKATKDDRQSEVSIPSKSSNFQKEVKSDESLKTAKSSEKSKSSLESRISGASSKVLRVIGSEVMAYSK